MATMHHFFGVNMMPRFIFYGRVAGSVLLFLAGLEVQTLDRGPWLGCKKFATF